jgi:hypothetical protein
MAEQLRDGRFHIYTSWEKNTSYSSIVDIFGQQLINILIVVRLCKIQVGANPIFDPERVSQGTSQSIRRKG